MIRTIRVDHTEFFSTKTLGVMEEDPVVSPPPSEDDIEDRITGMKYMNQHKPIPECVLRGYCEDLHE